MKKIVLLLFFIIICTQYTEAQTNVGGIISNNTTWDVLASPYIVTSNVLINSGVILTIEEGVTVKFNTGKSLQNKGTIIARGTSSNRIIFTSNQVTPTPGDWGGIDFSNETVDASYDINGRYSSGTILEYADILYGGSGVISAVKITNSAIYINNVTVKYSNSYGIYFLKSAGGTVPESKIINSSIINNNSSGVYCECYQYDVSITVDSSNITNNNGDGINTGGGDNGGTHMFRYTNNIIADNTGTGIVAYANGTQTIVGNIINNNSSNGVKLRGLGTYTVQKNIITNNGSFGVYGIYANHIIDQNVIANNGGGVKISQDGSYIITNNQIYKNTGTDGSVFNPLEAWTSPVTIQNNTIVDNTSSEATLSTFQPSYSGDPSFIFNYNNVFKNESPYQIKNNRSSSYSNIDAKNNYWNTIIDSEVQSLIYDWNDNSSLSIVDYLPYLSTPNTSAPISPPTEVFKYFSDSIEISWHPNPESDVAGYKIYYGNYTGYSFANSINVGNVTSYSIAGLSLSDTFAVTAYDNQADGLNDQIEGHESWYAQSQLYFNSNLLSGDSYCQGQEIVYHINTNAHYNANNNFIIQLSDTLGSFDYPIDLISVDTSSSLNINTSFPDTVFFDKTYLIRVKSTNPEIIGESFPVVFNQTSSPFFDLPSSVCFNNAAMITYTGNGSSNELYNWDFNGGNIVSGTGQGPYEIQWNTSGIKNISLAVTKNGCSSDTAYSLTVKPQTQPISICIVGVDSSSKNMIVWERIHSDNVDSVKVYKETSQAGIYQIIGTKSASETGSFVDVSSNPAQNANRYKISLLDSCGYETPQSELHKTIHLTINAGIGGAWNLIWDSYEGVNYNTYNIYRGTSGNNLLKIAEMPSNLTSYSDLTPTVGTTYYQIEVVSTITCDPDGKTNSYNSSKSNISNSSMSNINNHLLNELIEIAPNPATDLFTLFNNSYTFTQNSNVTILDIQGKVLFSKELINNSAIDISSLAKGIYVLRITLGNESVIKKLIKE